ncbi:MAG: HPP family protein [Burkholderiales bacterium]|nr:HPP family protein [Burkholderiales bacterium]
MTTARAVWRRALALLRPAVLHVSAREQWRAALGAGLGILIAALAGRAWAGGGAATLWLAAPMGAAAVLVFAVPSSPLAQPWAVIGGNTLSALAGVLCAHWIRDAALAAAAGVTLAIVVMFALRCLHPPGGATALVAATTSATPGFALFPVLPEAVLLVFSGMLYHRLTGRAYPHAQRTMPPAAGARFTERDLDQALAHYNQVLDISRDDLAELLHHAEAAAYQRTFGELRCSDIMSAPVHTVRAATALGEAWTFMRGRRIKALPVVDEQQHLLGIVTLADFMRHAEPGATEGMGRRLRGMLRAGRPETVGHIMTREVRVASAGRRVSELVPLFSHDGHHHVPIVTEGSRLVGIITQSDLVRALHRSAAGAGDARR